MDTSANNFVSADIGGTPVDLIFREFAAKFSSVDISGIGGIAYFEAVAVISGERVVLPLILDPTSVDVVTSESEDNTWYISNTPLDFAYTLTLDESTSTPQITLSGFVDLVGDGNYWSYLTVTLSKVADTTPSNEEVNALLGGTWQTPLTEGTFTGGGFVYLRGGTADDLLISGIQPVDAVFSNFIFDNTDFANNNAELSDMSLLAFLSDDNEWAEENETEASTMVFFNYENADITRLFGNIYKIEYDDPDITDDDYVHHNYAKAILMIDDNNKGRAYLLTCYINSDEDSYEEIRTVQALEKKPEDSIYTLESQDGTVWISTSTSSATAEFIDASTGEPTDLIDIERFGIRFNKVEEDSLNVSVMAEYYLNSTTSYDISFDLTIDHEVIELGYNAWYCAALDGKSDFTMTFISEDLAIIAVDFLNPATNHVVRCVAFIKRADINTFFSGAWTSTSSDAKVYLHDGAGSKGDLTLLNFGAYFSSVDIDAGTAKFSAFTVLSNDLLLIPVVFDNETVSIDAGTTEGEFIVSTDKGSFTVSGNSSEPDKLNINGKFYFKDTGLTVSIDAVATKFQATDKLDFDSIMKASTWQTTPLDTKSGGFALMVSPAINMSNMYPGINYKTFSALTFDGDSTGATVSGFGTMGLLSFDFAANEFVDSGATVPITIAKESIDVDNIFGNYYRFSFASNDAELLKGVFILEGNDTARMILFAANKIIDTSETRIYTVFSLNKITESTQIELTAFNNTSWDVEQAGGVVRLHDGTILQITNSDPVNYQVRMTSFDVKFTNVNTANNTFDFAVSAYIDLITPTYTVNGQYVEFTNQTVTVEKLGSYMWYGKQGKNEFILTGSSMSPSRAALAGALNFASPTNANFNVEASILLDLVLKQKE